MFSMSIYALGTATLGVTARNRDHIMAARILNCEASFVLVSRK